MTDFCRNLVCGRPMEPVAFLLHLRLWPPVVISPLCVARLVCTEPGTRTRPPCLACFAPMLIFCTRTPTPPPVCSLSRRPARPPRPLRRIGHFPSTSSRRAAGFHDMPGSSARCRPHILLSRLCGPVLELDPIFRPRPIGHCLQHSWLARSATLRWVSGGLLPPRGLRR